MKEIVKRLLENHSVEEELPREDVIEETEEVEVEDNSEEDNLVEEDCTTEDDELVDTTDMSIERSIIEKLKESRRLDENFPPILNKLNKYAKKTVAATLTKAGIDIENTPAEMTVITNGRDPRLKGKNVVVFEFQKKSYIDCAVWFDGKFIVDAYIYDVGTEVSKMSWKNILEYANRITVLEFDEQRAAALKQKQSDRKSAQQGREVRYTNKNKPKYVTLDKSGYIVDPKKYQKMLADMKLKDAPAILNQAKDIYVKLANNLDKINWEDEQKISSFESYDYLMKAILREFQDMTKNLKEFEKYGESHEPDDWWYDMLKSNVTKSIQEMRELIKKAKKYI